MPLSNSVDNPIINNPYTEPTQHYDFSGYAPQIVAGRRPAGYLRGNRSQVRSMVEQDTVPLELVNTIRARVKSWRERGYPGASRITQDLLRHWTNPERDRKLFFAQVEAAETLIWLVEASPAERAGITVPSDGGAFARACLKLATGSGKTTVMAMLIAWSVLNKVTQRQSKKHSDAVLIVAPNLTVKERLQVLLPTHADNYYQRFDLVPGALLPLLGQGRYMITNWHVFNPQEDSPRSVVQLGPESDTAFCNRVLRDLGTKQNLLVINDEAHHAYRIQYNEEPPMLAALGEGSGVRRRAVTSTEHMDENREATVWVGGLDRIHAVRRITMCLDLSATPYYIKGSGREEGSPFDWIVSDFGLVDAIESGLVKVPRIPVDDNSGDARPRYFNLWDTIKVHMPKKRSGKGDQGSDALRQILIGTEGALAMLASEWCETFQEWQAHGRATPPVLIVVCNETSTAQVLHTYIANGQVLPELRNMPGESEVTIRIDSRMLAQAESRNDGESAQDAAERLREVLATVGKVGQPGEHVRCVVSVGMLTEGWDAQTVTHILGLRAFSSQLLCEQVVGRGLRRSSYDDLSEPEFVDVYGIPFQAIPVQEVKATTAKPPPAVYTVQALAERANMAISFPRVTGYISDIREQVTADIASLPILRVEPFAEPTTVISGTAGHNAPFQAVAPRVMHDRHGFYRVNRVQSTAFRIAAQIVKDFHQDANRQQLFPQVLRLVNDYLQTRIYLSDEAVLEDVALARYQSEIAERIRTALRSVTPDGEPPIRPVLDAYRPVGSTADVVFTTTREIWKTTKSHVSHVVQESRWEKLAAQILESHRYVCQYVRNYKLDFTIPYRFAEANRLYVPDFIIVCAKNPADPDAPRLNLVLEIKGEEDERDRAKAAGARRWVDAVNYDGRWGRWAYEVCKDTGALRTAIDVIVSTKL